MFSKKNYRICINNYCDRYIIRNPFRYLFNFKPLIKINLKYTKEYMNMMICEET